jgi:hypothetical protein
LKSYRDLNIYNDTFDLAIKMHQLSLRILKMNYPAAEQRGIAKE